MLLMWNEIQLLLWTSRDCTTLWYKLVHVFWLLPQHFWGIFVWVKRLSVTLNASFSFPSIGPHLPHQRQLLHPHFATVNSYTHWAQACCTDWCVPHSDVPLSCRCLRWRSATLTWAVAWSWAAPVAPSPHLSSPHLWVQALWLLCHWLMRTTVRVEFKVKATHVT